MELETNITHHARVAEMAGLKNHLLARGFVAYGIELIEAAAHHQSHDAVSGEAGHGPRPHNLAIAEHEDDISQSACLLPTVSDVQHGHGRLPPDRLEKFVHLPPRVFIERA